MTTVEVVKHTKRVRSKKKGMLIPVPYCVPLTVKQQREPIPKFYCVDCELWFHESDIGDNYPQHKGKHELVCRACAWLRRQP